MHYQRNRKHGSPHYVRAKETAEQFEARFWAHVDKSSECWIWTGDVSKSGYGMTYAGSSNIRAHRQAYEFSHGPIPKGVAIDHICHTLLCVRADHLRLATVKQNMENRAGARRGSKSGMRGVSWHAKSGRWVAAVTHNYKKHVAGSFSNPADAAVAAQALRNKLFTHNNLDRISS